MSEELKKTVIESTTKLVELIVTNCCQKSCHYTEKSIKGLFEDIYNNILKIIGSDIDEGI